MSRRVTGHLTLLLVLDDFFFRALLATLAVAAVAGPTGCVILWQRKAYFGDTMAHSALLGVVLGIILGLNPEAGVFGVAFLVAATVVVLQRVSRLPGDTILGVLAHSTLAIGLVAMALTDNYRQYELTAYLFGDVLAVGREDLVLIGLGGLFGLVVLAAIWRPLVAATLHEGLAAAEGAKPLRNQLLYMALVAAVVAVGMQVVGALLVVALMIVPAAAARTLAHTPEQMALIAVLIATLSGVLGLYGSLWLDTPAGPTIVTVAAFLFLGCLAFDGGTQRLSRSQGVRRGAARAPEDDA
ncbi:MAG: metal ABC transporter permease [Gammaproteobacteria bacterium]|nr:metal ABC transporter permease [Gammaproteobacteria bacterium]